MPSDKYTKYIKYFYLTACAVVFIYFLPKLLHLFMPFLLAFVIAAPFHKIVEFLASRFNINRSLSSIVIFVLILLIIISLIGGLIYYLITQIKSFIEILPETFNKFGETLNILKEKLYTIAPSLAKSIDNAITNSNGSLSAYTPQITDSAIDYATDVAVSLPSALFFTLIFLLSVFFFIKDYSSVMNFFREAIPEKTLSIFRYLKNTAWNGFVGYIKSQLILSSITAGLIAITFLILGIDYAVIWALIIGIVDILPILGSGIILVPYALLVLFIEENVFLAIIILILQLVCFLVRQVLSPRIMSSQLGLNPIITLISIYIGNEVIGISGMIIFPIFALLIVSIYKAYKSAGGWENIANLDKEKDEAV
ncbi:MAG: sporulation integral membrane protein YtvI [Ruminococcaceae bacterium]|nr:sporulation integral membrane protein YtvI [Oscillospiraceae bacterium]